MMKGILEKEKQQITSKSRIYYSTPSLRQKNKTEEIQKKCIK